MKRKTGVIPLLAVLCLLLAGCSGEPGSFIPESSQTTSIEGQAPEEEASGTSLPGLFRQQHGGRG